MLNFALFFRFSFSFSFFFDSFSYIDRIEQKEEKDTDHVWRILQTPAYARKIIYPKKLSDFPTQDKKWVIVMADATYLGDLRRFGREIIGVDTVFKLTE